MISDDKLIGWICFARHQFSNGFECLLPKAVSDAIIARGWIEACDKQDDCQEWNAHITDAGLAVTDLNAHEWGLISLPQESEA